MIDDRPSPDALLRAARREGRGRLKILLGAAPGVGKTVEMLREGADMLAAGIDVVLGVVETHGRTGTAALIGPFEVLPRCRIAHAGHALDEFDLDAMLARRPKVALIDEFAHTNAPGSRHPKRWQDVEELRDAGIDVVTTLNIQHVESLNDVVAGFTHVRVRETVPDSCLEDAELEVVDLPPGELIERLQAGQIYAPGEAARALGNFFTAPKLSALRELALRRAAQVVDRQVLDHVRAAGAAGTFAGGERVVVAIGDQPGADALVRAGKRLADAFGASWNAVSVETPRSATLPAEARAEVARALTLAATLGATVATIPSADVASGLRAHLAEARATVLVIAKSRRSRWFEWRHASVVDALVRTLDGVAVHVVAGADAPRADAPARRPMPWAGLAASLLGVAATTAAAWLLAPVLGGGAVDLLYLVPVVAAAAFAGLRPALASAFASALAYNFFFLPPLFTFRVDDPKNLLTVVVLAGVGLVTAELTGRLRRQAAVGARGAAENAALAAFGQRLATASDEAGTAGVVCEEVGRLLDVAVVVVTRSAQGPVVAGSWPDPAALDPIDTAAASWALERGEPAGRDSATLAASEWQFHPLVTSLGVLAVMGVAAAHAGSPVPPERALLFATLRGQAALAWERVRLEADAREVAALRQRDDLRAALLSSIGHDLRTPLTGVVAAADALDAEAVANGAPASPTLATLIDEAHRLRRFFDDLIEMTRLESGALGVRLEATDLTDAAAAALRDLRRELDGRRVVVSVPATLPLVRADPRLLHHILINLIGNAAKFTPAGGTVELAGAFDAGGVTLAVRDDGPGLPPGDPQRLFERFTRVEGGDRAGGTGLGLAIVKGFADAMRLVVTAADRPAGGACFTIAWPPAAVMGAMAP